VSDAGTQFAIFDSSAPEKQLLIFFFAVKFLKRFSMYLATVRNSTVIEMSGDKMQVSKRFDDKFRYHA